MRQILTTVGRILMFIVIALLSFIIGLTSILNPFYYKKIFKKINTKASRLMNDFSPIISEDGITDNTGEYFSLLIVLAGIVILLLSLKSLLV